MTDSTPTDDPTNAGAPNQGDVKTAVLDNLTKPSEGEPASTPPPEPSADKTGQPKGDVQPPDDTGKLSRLEQRLAQNNQLLAALNIDPESDIAERYQRGLVSKEELLLRAGVQVQAEPKPAPKPTSAMDQLGQLKQRVGQSVRQNKGITERDILEFMDVASDLATENVQLREQTDMERHFSNCRSATLSVIEKDPMHSDLPDNIKEIESQVFLSSTDNLLVTENKANPKALTVQNYGFYADKNLQRLNDLRNHWIEHGKKLQQQAVTGKPSVNPMSPTTGSAPITPPETPTTLNNMEERARAYMERQGTV